MSSVNNKKISHPGQRLKKARDFMQLSQEKFALRLGYMSYQPIKDLESGRKIFRPHIAKLIQCEFGINATWLLEGKGDMLIDSAQEESVDVQKMIEGVVAETRSSYGKKLLPEEEKFAEIQAYIEEVRVGGLRAQGLFADKFIECFGDFKAWHREKHRAIKTNSRKIEKETNQ